MSEQTIRVHVLDPYGGGRPDDAKSMFDAIVSDAPHYRVEFWKVGPQITPESADRLKDPQTGDLYALVQWKDDGCHMIFLPKHLWEKGKAEMDSISERTNTPPCN